jgi:arylsulfatase A-like enzyme
MSTPAPALTPYSLLLPLLLLIQACSHPLEITGEGDILSSTGTRDCTYEAFQAGDIACTKNNIIGTYSETYTAVPRPGWKFDGWENYCVNSNGNTCPFNVPNFIIEDSLGSSVPPLRALFSPAPTTPSTPNVVIILMDDMGYADIGIQGASFTTPNIDALANSGVRFTDFYVTTPVCSGTRAALMTGSSPTRIGMPTALYDFSNEGIHPDETTLAETFQSAGYRTAIFGKWHIGHAASDLLPNAQGFDEYYGITVSHQTAPSPPHPSDVPMLHNGVMVDPSSDPATYTAEFTNRTIDFIEESTTLDEPFFVYLAHPLPHIPLAASASFVGASGTGLYGDVIQELDWSVDQVVNALEDAGIAQDTLVILSSDNGPLKLVGGRATPLSKGKTSYYEGSIRVPMIAYWPSVLDAGRVVETPAMIFDLFPTLQELIGAAAPPLKIDGESIWQLMTGESFEHTQEAQYFYFNSFLMGMRSGKWKLMFPRPAHLHFNPADPDTELYDLQNDIGETTNVAALYPDIVVTLDMMADTIRAELGDAERGIPCTECRLPGLAP